MWVEEITIIVQMNDFRGAAIEVLFAIRDLEHQREKLEAV